VLCSLLTECLEVPFTWMFECWQRGCPLRRTLIDPAVGPDLPADPVSRAPRGRANDRADEAVAPAVDDRFVNHWAPSRSRGAPAPEGHVRPQRHRASVTQPLVARRRGYDMVPQQIEREILIQAPVDVVWAVVTELEHVSGWFSDSVELDLRPGGEMALHWNGHGTVRGRVERVEAPQLFSFRWVVGQPGHELIDESSTLVEFRLSPEGDSTRLTVVETGFSDLAGTEDENRGHFEDHQQGWNKELGELVDYLAQRSRR